MKQLQCAYQDDLWKLNAQGQVVCVTTNGITKTYGPEKGQAVMGAGVALQAKLRYPNLPLELGSLLVVAGNHVYWFPKYRLFTFPTKNDYRDKSTLELIAQSARELVQLVEEQKILDTYGHGQIYLPRPGCSNGGLDWKDVCPVLEEILDDRFAAVSL